MNGAVNFSDDLGHNAASAKMRSSQNVARSDKVRLFECSYDSKLTSLPQIKHTDLTNMSPLGLDELRLKATLRLFGQFTEKISDYAEPCNRSITLVADQPTHSSLRRSGSWFSGPTMRG